MSKSINYCERNNMMDMQLEDKINSASKARDKAKSRWGKNYWSIVMKQLLREAAKTHPDNKRIV